MSGRTDMREEPPYRIALVSDWYLPRLGGVERHLSELAHRLAAGGHDVQVVTSARGGNDDDGVRVHRLSLPLLRGDIAWPDLRRIADLRELFLRERFDVVHAHGLFSSVAIGGLVAASALGIPSVTTHHSLVDGIRDPLARIVFAIWSRRATLVTAVSAAAARDAARVSGRSDVGVLPNGIDVTAWAGRAPDDGTLHIVACGRLVGKKRFADLIGVLPALLGRMRDPGRVRVTIAGDGAERPRLVQLARARGLDGQVTFPGWLTRDGVRHLLGTADIFVSTCRTEAFGVALLEARCAGVPVVAMAGGGVEEVAEHGRTALVARSPVELGEHLYGLAEDLALRQRLRSNARTGLERFDWSRVIPAHVHAYEQAMHARRA